MLISKEKTIMVSRQHNPALFGLTHNFQESLELPGTREITRVTDVYDPVAFTPTFHKPLQEILAVEVELHRTNRCWYDFIG
jgi:hypothetical protein